MANARVIFTARGRIASSSLAPYRTRNLFHPKAPAPFHTFSRSHQADLSRSVACNGAFIACQQLQRGWHVFQGFATSWTRFFLFGGIPPTLFGSLAATYHFLFTTLAPFSGATCTMLPPPWHEGCLICPRPGPRFNSHFSGERLFKPHSLQPCLGLKETVCFLFCLQEAGARLVMFLRRKGIGMITGQDDTSCFLFFFLLRLHLHRHIEGPVSFYL